MNSQSAPDVAELFANALQQHRGGDLMGARQQYQAVLARDPNHVESLHHLGIVALQSNDPQLAVDMIGRAIALNDRVADLHYNIGIAYGALGRLDRVAEHNRAAIKLKPDFGPAFMNLGRALTEQGQHDEAIASYKRAIGLMPKSPEALTGYANALAAAGQNDAAISQYRKVLALAPDHAETHNNLGTLLAAQEKFDDAITCYQQALRINPMVVAARFNLANTFHRQGRLAEAAENYRGVLDLNPNSAEAYNNLGVIALFENRPEEAAGFLQRAAALRPHGAAFRNLGRAARALGDVRNALEAWRQAQQLEDTEEIRSLIYGSLIEPEFIDYSERFRDLIALALAGKWGDREPLLPSAVAALGDDATIADCLDRVGEPGTDMPAAESVFEGNALQALAGNTLLLAVLSGGSSSSEYIDRLADAIRAALAAQPGDPALEPLRKAIATA